MLRDGLHDVPPGKLAVVVTYLECATPPPCDPAPAPRGLTLTRVAAMDPDAYRALFRAVGTRDWLWTSRLLLDDAGLTAILHAPTTELLIVRDGNADVGLAELDFCAPGTCELAFFGLLAAQTGRGAGRWLMGQALARGFARATRVTVHTCTHDSPAALAFYQRMGFRGVRRAVEIFDDPRRTGHADPADAAMVPVL